MSIDLNQVIEYFRLKDRKGMDPKVMEDMDFRERTNASIWINNPNYSMSEIEMIAFLDSAVRIKGELQIVKDLLKSAGGISTMDYYAMKNDEPQSTFGLYKIHKNRILNYLKTGEILKKEGSDLKFFSFENGLKMDKPTKEDYMRFLQSIHEKKQIVYIDTETTGLYPERGDTAIQIYLLRTFQGKKVSDLRLYVKTYKNPVSIETVAIHHIDDTVLANEAIYPIEALQKIKCFLETNDNTVLFGHNVNFDLRMLQFMYNDWHNAGVEPYSFSHIDTMEIVKNILQRYNPNIEKSGLSYIIKKYMGDVDLDELKELMNDYIDRTHNHEEERYNGDKAQFAKDTLSIERKILKNMDIFLTKEKENDLLVDKDTNIIQGFYEELIAGKNSSENEKVETFRHIVLLIQKKIDRRHQADYDVIQTFSMVEKIIKDFGKIKEGY